MASYRSRSRIILDLLHAVDSPRSVSGLLHDANLSHPRLREYLGELANKGWVGEVSGGWRITESGRRVRAQLDRVARDMADFGLEF